MTVTLQYQLQSPSNNTKEGENGEIKEFYIFMYIRQHVSVIIRNFIINWRR